jgi:hypothetical protein
MAQMTPAPGNFMEPIRSALAETLGLSYADILPQVMNLRVTLDSTKISDTDEYRIDGGYHFIGYEVRAHIASNVPSAEAYAGAAGTLTSFGSFQHFMAAKALNCRVELFNPDREALRYIETDVQNSGGNVATSLSLAALLPIAGGAPIKFCEGNEIVPLLVMEGDRIRMKATLNETAAEIVGQQTEYGLTIFGAYVRARTT